MGKKQSKQGEFASGDNKDDQSWEKGIGLPWI